MVVKKLAIAMLCVGACLPADSRPEPAAVHVTAGPSDATKSGFQTADGWTITFGRFVTALGDVDLDGDPDGRDDSCNSYSETHYERLFDFTVASEEKVALVHGLGTCSVEVRLRGPSDDALLGAGATEADAASMNEEATDAYTDEPRRTTLVVRGVAVKGDVTKRFDWAFRNSFEIDRCKAASGDGYVTVLRLEGGQERSLHFEVRGEELFRRGTAEDAPMTFDLHAESDRDGDGFVTLAELGETEVPPDLDLADDSAEELERSEPATMADLTYEWLLPRIVRVEGAGPCEAELRGR